MKNQIKFGVLIIILSIAIQPAKAEGELNVYTSRKEHLVKPIFEEYTKKTGIKVNYKTGKAGELIQNILTEGENTKADIFMTVDAGNLSYAANEGILTTLNSEVLASNVPTHMRDPKNRWFGLSVRARTTVVNKDLFKAKTITYEDLARPEWKGKLCLRTSKKVYNQSLVAMLIDQHGKEKAKKIVEGWVANNVEIFSNDTNVLKAVAAGRCAVGIVNTYYFGRLIKKEPKLPLKIVWPNQSNYGTHVNISGAGIVKFSKNQTAAGKFLEWLSSREAQKSFAQVNMEYPVLTSAKNDPLVDSWGDFKGNTSFKLYLAGDYQQEAVKLMREAGYK